MLARSNWNPISIRVVETIFLEITLAASRMSARPDNVSAILTSEEARKQLHSACHQQDVSRVRQLFSTTSSLCAADATEVLRTALPHRELTRVLLEKGADPNYYFRISAIRSFDLVKLLVGFGYDIASTGHLLLQ